MDLDEFAALKVPHLVALTAIVLISALTVGYGIFAFSHPLNSNSECDCMVSDIHHGTSINKESQ